MDSTHLPIFQFFCNSGVTELVKSVGGTGAALLNKQDIFKSRMCRFDTMLLALEAIYQDLVEFCCGIDFQLQTLCLQNLNRFFGVVLFFLTS